MNNKNPWNWLRWTARITGTLLVAFTLFIFIGELMESQQRHTPVSYTPIIIMIFIVWGIALGGLVLALWKEGPGGLISFVCFMLVYVLNLFNKEATMKANAITLFIIFCVPSILYLLYWKLSSDNKSTVLKQGEPGIV